MNQITIPVASEVITNRLSTQAFNKNLSEESAHVLKYPINPGAFFLRSWLSLSGPADLAHRIEAIGPPNYKSLNKAIRMILFDCAVEP